MFRLIVFYIISFVLLSAMSCKKDSMNNQCQMLRESISSDNAEETKNIIEKYISNLPSDAYSQQNLNKLAEAISNSCGMNVNVLCFDCIDTLPSQSEIWLSFNYSGLQVSKTIDISYTTDNKMKFVNLH